LWEPFVLLAKRGPPDSPDDVFIFFVSFVAEVYETPSWEVQSAILNLFLVSFLKSPHSPELRQHISTFSLMLSISFFEKFFLLFILILCPYLALCEKELCVLPLILKRHNGRGLRPLMLVEFLPWGFGLI